MPTNYKTKNKNVNFNTYVTNAKKTESVIDNKTPYDGLRLYAGMNFYVLASEVLDQVKREIFYGKTDPAKMAGLYMKSVKALDLLGNVLKNTDGAIEAMEHYKETEDYQVDKVDYIKMSERKELNCNTRLLHGVVGLGTESGEMVKAFLESLLNQELDMVNMAEELGDMHWYEAIILDEKQIDVGKMLSTNIKKLKKRYPWKFDKNLAIQRDLTQERKVLEKGLSTKASKAKAPQKKALVQNTKKNTKVIKNKKK